MLDKKSNIVINNVYKVVDKTLFTEINNVSYIKITIEDREWYEYCYLDKDFNKIMTNANPSINFGRFHKTSLLCEDILCDKRKYLLLYSSNNINFYGSLQKMLKCTNQIIE